MHTILWLQPQFSDTQIAALAFEAGIAVKAVSNTFSKTRQRSGLIIGLADFDQRHVQQAIEKLAQIIKETAITLTTPPQG